MPTSLNTSLKIKRDYKIRNKIISKENLKTICDAIYTEYSISKEQYFEFKKHKYGPYANSISIISRTIREFQKYHNVKNTQEAYKILYNKIISEKIQNRMKILTPSILKATQYVNSIETNHELDYLTNVLSAALKSLKVGGRLAIITFHSLEDRIVKKAFKEVSEVEGNRHAPVLLPSEEKRPSYHLVNRQVITAGEEELEYNPRSKSAKLRIIERIDENDER